MLGWNGRAAIEDVAELGGAPDFGSDQPMQRQPAAMLLDWRGRRCGNARLAAAGMAISAATDRVLANSAARTRDLGGPLGTMAFADRLIAAIPPV